MTKKQSLLFLSLALMSTGCAAAAGPLGFGILSAVVLSLALFAGACDSGGKSSYRIFVTAKTTNGHLGDDGGTTGADTMCNDVTDDNNPNDGATFKAMIASSTRDHTKDWVLKASTEYTRLDGTVIGTTDADARLVSPLTDSITQDSERVWTGLSTDFMVYSFQSYIRTCNDWASDQNTYTGQCGDSSTSHSSAWHSVYQSCLEPGSLICVEQ